MKIQDKFKDDRPREKLKRIGASGLTDLELLMAIIGSGNAKADVGTLARKVLKILKEYKTCHPEFISESPDNHNPETLNSSSDSKTLYQQLQEISGLGVAKITEILAAFELARRYLTEPDRPIIDSPEKVATILSDVRHKTQEHFVLLTLDGANRLIKKHIITIGTLTSSLVHPREVFAPAISDRAAAIIVAHNHPSGNLTPSQADNAVTARLKSVGEMVGIPLLDHIIITKIEHKSIM